MTPCYQTRTYRASAFIIEIIALVCSVAGKKVILESSFDEGRTWQRHDESRDWAPPLALLRPEESSSVFMQVPRCALTSPLQVQLWRLNSNSDPFGMSWESEGCDTTIKTSSIVDGIPVKSTFHEIKRLEPRWWKHIRERSASVEEIVVDGKSPKSKGFFGKYGLFIMAAIGIALAHGIRIGLSELHDEFQREEARATTGAPSARGRPVPESVHIAVPQTKRSARQRKKTAKGAAASSKHAS